MIRILSGWSNPGGSTTAFINLTNALNEFGYETIFMGPHPFHLDKCKSIFCKPGEKLKIKKEDILIVHFRNNFIQRPPIKGFFLSCHEQDIFPLKDIKYEIFDKIHYVSKHQRDFHSIDHPHFILPNVLDDLKPNKKPSGKIAGIVGSIDKNKRVHTSIKRALEDGCDKVLIYGVITDPWYWQTKVQHMVDGDKVVFMSFEDDKQKIYDSVTDVYHSSKSETWGYIKGECKMTNTEYHGNSSTDGYWEMDKKEIVKNWVEEIGYEN
ncbi:MAG: hypothetical protein ACOC80_10815 [Petrotogales bacterium]